jgi:hypothetical protein
VTEVVTLGRSEFVTQYFDYSQGEHVTFLAPTGGGKTTFAYELLSQVSSPRLPAISLVMKPRDTVVKKWGKTLGYKTVRHWPPTITPWSPQTPPGYILWPKHTFDPDRDDVAHAIEFRKAILHSYKKGKRILFADETLGLTHELGLARECVTVWTKGRSMDTGLWAATQKPSHIPLYAYNQASHIFLAYDPDKRNRDRFSEIGGVDPDLLKTTVLNLQKYQWLYVRRDGPVMCIVDKN